MSALKVSIWLLATGFISIAVGDDMMSTPHTAVDLTDVGWSGVFGKLDGSSPALVEFYANWCPHCRSYAPTYEKVAKFFKANAEKGGLKVFVGRVDCAVEVGCLRCKVSLHDSSAHMLPACSHLVAPIELHASVGFGSYSPITHCPWLNVYVECLSCVDAQDPC